MSSLFSLKAELEDVSRGHYNIVDLGDISPSSILPKRSSHARDISTTEIKSVLLPLITASLKEAVHLFVIYSLHPAHQAVPDWMECRLRLVLLRRLDIVLQTASLPSPSSFTAVLLSPSTTDSLIVFVGPDSAQQIVLSSSSSLSHWPGCILSIRVLFSCFPSTNRFPCPGPYYGSWKQS